MTEPTALAVSVPEFKHYSVVKLNVLNLSLCPASSAPDIINPATYTIINCTFTPSVPDLTMRLGPDRTSPIVGVARLPYWGANTFGIGDPESSSEGEGASSVVWEKMQRTSKWVHATYEFEWEWSDGERRKYEWRRTKLRVFDDQDDLELVERGRDAVALATYECGNLFRWKMRGDLKIRILHEERQDERDRWETVVALTAMSLVELARRRARARRSNGGGGGGGGGGG